MDLNTSKINDTILHESALEEYGFENLEAKDILLALILVVINILIFCGNILVIICLLFKNSKSRLRRGRSNKQRRTNIFIVNLAFTDLTLSLLIIPPNILQVISGKWMLGNTFCKVPFIIIEWFMNIYSYNENQVECALNFKIFFCRFGW